MTRLLELCGIRAGDTVTVVHDDSTEDALLETARLATDRSHTQTTTLRTAGSQNNGRPLANPAISGALHASTYVVDLTAAGCTSEQDQRTLEAVDTKVFWLGQISTDDLSWFVPHPGLAVRLAGALRILERAAVVRVSSKSDHVLEVSMREVRATTASGVLDDVSFARFPGGLLTLTPGAATVSGSIALMPGDINTSAHTFVKSPVVLVIADDRVCDILGSGADADLIRAQFEAPDHRDAYGIGSAMIGMHRRWPEPHGFDDALLTPDRARLSGGHTSIRFGTNTVAGRVAPASIEFALRRASVETDSDQIVASGELIGELAPDIYEQAAFD